MLVIAAIWVFLHVFSLLSVVLVPVIIGLLFSAVAVPGRGPPEQWGVPRGLATVLTILTGLALIVALVALVAQQFSSGFGDLRDQFDRSLNELQRYLADLGLSRAAAGLLRQGARRSRLRRGLGGTVVKTATTAGHLLAGLFIALFATIFFIYDGRNIWRWIVGLFPSPARDRVEGSGGVRGRS